MQTGVMLALNAIVWILFYIDGNYNATQRI